MDTQINPRKADRQHENRGEHDDGHLGHFCLCPLDREPRNETIEGNRDEGVATWKAQALSWYQCIDEIWPWPSKPGLAQPDEEFSTENGNEESQNPAPLPCQRQIEPKQKSAGGNDLPVPR